MSACQALRKPNIQRAIKLEREARWKRLRVNGDETMALISQNATADIGLLYGPTGALLPIAEWPAWMRLCVQSIRPGPFGDTVVLHDGLRARELLAIAAGKLRGQHDVAHSWDPAAYLGAEPPKGDDE